jgi:hypothetical protein
LIEFGGLPKMPGEEYIRYASNTKLQPSLLAAELGGRFI